MQCPDLHDLLQKIDCQMSHYFMEAVWISNLKFIMTFRNMRLDPFRPRGGETKAKKQSRGAVLPFWELEGAGRYSTGIVLFFIHFKTAS